MNFFDNITFRKTKTRSLEMSDETSLNSSKLDGSTSSLPNISGDENNIQIQELQNQIAQLTSQLNSAHEEIKNLNIENTELKKIVNELTSKNDLLKKATKKLTTEVGTPNKSSLTSTPHPNPQPKSQKKTGKTQLLLEKQGTANASMVELDSITTQKEEPHDLSSFSLKRKLCIVSANNNNKVLYTAQEIFKNFQICHYVKPNSGVIRLIKDLQQKLINYSMSDYCVVLIGEEDFLQTENYVNIIITLRETLMSIQNTNIILCAPTFKLSDYSTMFNWRIETFNNLLHLDLQTYNYATAFDSNLNLSYDFTMFFKFNRKVNDCGMRNIFQNLLLTVTEITSTQYEFSDDEKLCEHENFFRV